MPGPDAFSSSSGASPAPHDAHLRRWQRITIGSLIMGYAGYYLCRSNLSVATPLLLESFGPEGFDKETLGMIVSWGVFFYAIGKVLNGVLGDFVGGRKMFILGMIGSVAATMIFGLGTGLVVLTLAWSLNRLVQSMGWVALVKIISNWFPFKRYGTVMGILSLSYLFGDAAARFFLGSLLNLGLGWRELFFASAATLAAITVGTNFLLKGSPRDIGAEEPPTNPNNVYGEAGERSRPPGLKALLVPFFKSPAFWMIAVLSLGLTLIREAFNFWTPTYLVETGGLSAGDAAQYSLLFPFFGGVSVVLFGYLTDRVGKGRRGLVIVAALALLVPVLCAMGFLQTATDLTLPLILVSLAAFLLLGPYSFLAGAISLDLGGKQGSATAAGLIDSAGYLGGILSGFGIGSLAQRLGWNAVFIALAVVAVLSLLTAALYWYAHERSLSRAPEIPAPPAPV